MSATPDQKARVKFVRELADCLLEIEWHFSSLDRRFDHVRGLVQQAIDNSPSDV